jgi:hypothetical protein
MSQIVERCPTAEQADLYRAVARLEPGDAVLMVMWHAETPAPSVIAGDAVTVLDESLATLVRAELPEGAVLGSWGRGRVLAIIPSTTATAAARAGRRVRRAWRAHWLAPVFCSAVALAAAPDVLTRAEPALRAAATHRTGSVVFADAIHDDGAPDDLAHDGSAHDASPTTTSTGATPDGGRHCAARTRAAA